MSENKHIIQYIENLPDRGWRDICDTDDRVNAFNLVNSIYRLIADRLKDFFECRELEEMDIICEDETLVKLTEERAEEYQLIYSALLKAWKYVKADLLEIQKLQGVPVNQDLTSLGFLLSICREDAKNMLEDIVFPEHVTGNNYSEYCVSRSYKIFVEANKIVKKIELANQWKKIIELFEKTYPKANENGETIESTEQWKKNIELYEERYAEANKNGGTIESMKQCKKIIQLYEERYPKANKNGGTIESTKQWKKIIQLYEKRYPMRKLCMDLLKLAALQNPSISPHLDHLDKFHGLTLINAPALFHPERVKDYQFISHTVTNGRINLKPKRTKKS